MAKVTWKAGTLEYPLPPVMVSSGTMENPNIMTVAWTGIISSEPAMTYISVRPSRFSHNIISERKEFVINLTNLPLVNAVDFCGVKSGKDTNKFKEMGLTAGKCSKIAAPQIVESPVSLECVVVDVKNYGTHDMFVAEIVAVNVDEKYIDKDGKLELEKAGLVAWVHNNYFTLGRNIGFFGFSVCKSDKKAKEKMKSIVVEIKEPKVLAEKPVEKTKAKFKTDERRGRRPAERKPREDGERRSFDRKPREGGFGRKPREDGERGERKSFERKPREDGERRSFDRKPREGSERGKRKSFDRKPREDGERRSFDRKPREGGFDRKPREDGERRSFDRKPREGGFDRKPREDGERRSFDRKPREGGRPMGRPSGGRPAGRPAGRPSSAPRKSFRK